MEMEQRTARLSEVDITSIGLKEFADFITDCIETTPLLRTAILNKVLQDRALVKDVAEITAEHKYDVLCLYQNPETYKLKYIALKREELKGAISRLVIDGSWKKDDILVVKHVDFDMEAVFNGI